MGTDEHGSPTKGPSPLTTPIQCFREAERYCQVSARLYRLFAIPKTYFEEKPTLSKSRKPGDIVRTPAYRGGFRVWRIAAVLLGGVNQEGLIELEPLDLIANDEGRVLVPAEILDAAVRASDHAIA